MHLGQLAFLAITLACLATHCATTVLPRNVQALAHSLPATPFGAIRRHLTRDMRDDIVAQKRNADDDDGKDDDTEDDERHEIEGRHNRHSERHRHARKRKHQFRGKATFYHGGPMACGGSQDTSQAFAALSTEMFSSGVHCGDKVTVLNKHNQKQVTVTILDECPGCKRTQLDLSTGAFDQLGSESTGVLHIKWWFD